MTSKQAREAWIQLGRDLRREQYVPLDSVNNPSIKMLDVYKQALRQTIEKDMNDLEVSTNDYWHGYKHGLRTVLERLDTVTPTKE